jgi:hypothetical protein
MEKVTESSGRTVKAREPKEEPDYRTLDSGGAEVWLGAEFMNRSRYRYQPNQMSIHT